MTRRNADLLVCLLVSKRLYEVAISFVYRNPSIISFRRFYRALKSKPELGFLVRSLDISRFRASIPRPLIQECLSVVPVLRQCRLMLEDLGDEGILETLFVRTQHLKVLEIKPCWPHAWRERLIPDLIHDFFIKQPLPSVGAGLTSLTATSVMCLAQGCSRLCYLICPARKGLM